MIDVTSVSAVNTVNFGREIGKSRSPHQMVRMTSTQINLPHTMMKDEDDAALV